MAITPKDRMALLMRYSSSVFCWLPPKLAMAGQRLTVTPFDAVRVTETGLKMTLPACSVVEVTIRG